MIQTLPFDVDGIHSRFGDSVCLSSLRESQDGWLFMMREATRRELCVLAKSASPLMNAFQGCVQEYRPGNLVKVCATSHENCQALRETIPGLRPRTLGLEPSFGFGDRLGIATPGHVRAMDVARARAGGKLIQPIFAQQSVREIKRTMRSPQDVLDDATWGAFEAGWRGDVGADADHLKTIQDVDSYAEAGFTLFTIDPGEHVDPEAESSDARSLKTKVASLPWVELESSQVDLSRRYSGAKIDIGSKVLTIEAEPILVSAAKYGKAVAHIVKMARYLATKNVEFELEISVDETDTPTSAVDHFYVASELKRLGVRWVSMAPRYVGAFEKAIDYRGDPSALHTNLIEHATIATQVGPYKLGLHSGSDKFSVYPLIREATGGLVHVKTAGTSYMEGLRVVANLDPRLFRAIVALAIERYAEDRRSYHVSADLASIPVLSKLEDTVLPRLLEEDPARQVLHVTYGSVLDTYGSELKATLTAHLEDYYQMLEKHFTRHLDPFC